MKLYFQIISCLSVLFFAINVLADPVKDRMKERLPVIQEMKTQGIIGENNQGFLEVIKKSSQDVDAVLASENKDRLLVYNAIAQKKKTSAKLVGERRYLQISEKANKGEWLQDATGRWYAKQ